MRYLSEFRNKKILLHLTERIRKEAKKLSGKRINLMEVCGTHTMTIGRFGIRQVLPENIQLLSGPGCPVCVTTDRYIDKAIAFSKIPKTIIATFGDLIKVPGSYSSLEKEKAEGHSIDIIYSPLDSLAVAEKNAGYNIILLGLGFEATAPAFALTIEKASKRNLKNLFLFSGHKLIPPAMELLMKDNEARIDGFICPGHVSAVIGSRPYEFIADRYKTPCVIAGFEPMDILESILMLLQKITAREKPSIEIQYTRIVKEEGNIRAVKVMEKIFRKIDSEWRGIGYIKESALALREDYLSFDAEKNFPVKLKKTDGKTRCICGDILKGTKIPTDCPLFGNLCIPESPVGACMVSSEGTCAAFYRYGNNEEFIY